MIAWLIAVLGTCVGLAAGLLGAGASIFTVLILLHVAGLDLERAITTSLAAVALASIVGVIPYARTGAVMWRAGLGFSAASMTGAYIGGRLSASIPKPILMAVFVATMACAALAMLAKRRRPDPASRAARLAQRVPVIASAGLMVGALTGTVGLGGGFAVVPLLVVAANAPIRSAVGTSLFVIAVNTLAGVAGHLPHLGIDVRWAVILGLTSSAGSLVGARIAKYANADMLRRAFAILMLVGAVAQVASSLVR